MEFKFITGKMGTGKTELARAIAQRKDYRVFEPSPTLKRNFLQYYKGEECIILDNIRQCCEVLYNFMFLEDSVSFMSQFITCKMLIITSCSDIDQFCKDVFDENENKAKQFKNYCRYRIETSYALKLE